MHKKDTARLPIGIFDSGVGGLTVLAAIKARLPQEALLYLGDTARLPYGTKSGDTITRYAMQASEKLVERHIKMLVVACNTATAAALPALRAAYPHLPVVGVVEPGAAAAVRVSPSGNILVLATESTIRNQAYTKAIHALRPDATVNGIPCSLFVSLAEEGWVAGPVAEAAARQYLEQTFRENTAAPDCLVLGCTHFPPLAGAIRSVIGPDVALVDSAATTAEAVEETLARLDLLRPAGDAPAAPRFLTTDAPERFTRVGSIFLGEPIPDDAVELVCL